LLDHVTTDQTKGGPGSSFCQKLVNFVKFSPVIT